MKKMKGLAFLLVLALSSTVQAGTPGRPEGVGKGLEPVAEAEYSNGMHLAVTRIKGRDYVFASASGVDARDKAALRVFDVTDPARPKKVASLPCMGGQGFLQISHDNKTLVVAEGASHDGSPCMPPGEMGFYTIDIRNPLKPKPLGWASVPRSGHTATTHPTKPIVYVSYGDVPGITGGPEFDIWSIANPSKPKKLGVGKVTGYHGPHDMAFNAKGNRAIAASMSAIQVLDTTDPADPKELEVLQCPGCSHNHEAHFTPDQKHVIVTEETSGGSASPCPMGGLYFYRFHPNGPKYMDLIGEWQPAEVLTPEGDRTNVPLCTSHVIGVSRDGTKVAASWHTGGVRVVDITDMEGIGVGEHGTGPTEIGWFVSKGADSWSAKMDRSGRYVFVNDREVGFQVFRINSKA